MRLETSSSQELANAHRMGHTCASLNGDLLLVWGGSDESVACLPAKNNHLWIYDTLSGYWRHRLCAGDCPPYLSAATSTLIGQRLFVFGGHSTAQDNWLNSLYCLDLDDFCWHDLGATARAKPAKPIRADKLVSWPYAGRMYVFGGYGWSQTEHLLELLDLQRDLQLAPDHRWPKFGWNNQLVEFDPRDNTWRWPSYSGKCPSARAAHSGALMGHNYYVFGGRDSRERLNDLYALDMRSLVWTQIATISSSLPVDRPPIRHLLEPPEEEDEIERAMAPSIEFQAGGRSNAQMAPSPSSSSSEPVERDQKRDHSSPITEEDVDDDSEEEDDDDEDSQQHQIDFIQLLERQSFSSSSSASDTVDGECGLAQLQSRLQDCDSSSTCPNRFETAAASSQHQERNQDLAVQDVDNREQNLASSAETAPAATSTGKEIAKPTGRSFASFTPISEREILLYGGISSLDQNLDDCWIFNTNTRQWTLIDLKNKHPRLWHTGARTRNNEVVIIGGSCSDKIDEICNEILTISLTPKSLKQLALDAAARSIRMRTVNRVKGLPSTVCKLIRLRKQAMRDRTRKPSNKQS